MSKKQKKELTRIICAAVLFTCGEIIGHLTDFSYSGQISAGMFIGAFALCGYPSFMKAAVNIIHGQVFDENFLMLVKTAFATGANKIIYSRELDEFGDKIDRGEKIDTSLSDDDISQVAQVLTSELLVGKFIQGRAILGVIGGPLNHSLATKVSEISKIKYKKRFLKKLLMNYEDRQKKLPFTSKKQHL